MQRILRIEYGVWASMLAGLLLAAPLAGAQDEAGFGVAASANISADFEASPTLIPLRPDLIGGNNGVLATGWLEELTVGESYHEIYQGVGESGTSLFDFDFHGFATLSGGGRAEVDVYAEDQNNASAAWWTASGNTGHYQWIELEGPTNASGNYVVSLTSHLGPVTGSNTQPAGFTYIWKVNAGTTLIAEPLEPGFLVRQLSTGVLLKEDCPSLALPACQFIPRYLTASGDVTVPGTNPILRISHSVSVSVRSADASALGAWMEMDLPAGVTYTSYEPVPEPSHGLLGATGLLVVAALKRRRT